MKLSRLSRRHTARQIVSRLALLTSAIAPAVHATDLYWDINGTTAGVGGTGTWDNSSLFWNTDSTGGAGGTVSAWSNGNNAIFTGITAAKTVTIAAGTTVAPSTVTFATGASNYTIAAGAGAALNITDPNNSIVMHTGTGTARAQIISAPIVGTNITVVSDMTGQTTNTLLSLNGTNSFSGNLTIGGASGTTNFYSEVNINNVNALPSTATVIFNRDLAQLLFTAGGASGTSPYTGTFTNNINLNGIGNSTSLSSSIGSTNSGTVVTLAGVISGTADLGFSVSGSGGQGKVVLANHETYTGGTNLRLASSASTSGIVGLGIDNALPTGTDLSLGTSGNSVSGTLDLAGFNQKVADFQSQGTGYLGGITNTNGSKTSTLTVSGSANVSFGVATGTNTASCNIGQATSSAVAGSTDNIAIVLDSNNTGSLTLVRPTGNTYTGGTTINGGSLFITNTSGSGTGTGAINVGTKGTFGGTGSASGAVFTSGSILPGGANAVGTLTLSGGLNASAGSSFTFDFGSGNDVIALGSSSLGLAGSSSVALTLNDLSNSLTNSTYTLFTGSNLSSTNLGAFKIAKPLAGVANNANYSLSADGTGIKLTISGVGSFKTWAGGVTGTWDTNNNSNADLTNGSPVTFSAGDVVTFDDTNGGDSTVNIAAGGVSPGNVIVNGTHNYTFNGSINSGGFTMNSTGTAVLLGNNSYAAGTTVNAGTLEIAGDSSLGAVPSTPTVNLTLVKQSATVNSTFRIDNDTVLNVNRNILLTQSAGGGPSIDTNGHNLTINGQILAGNGGANLVKFGNGVLTLNGDNSSNMGGGYIAATLVNGGFVNVTQDASLGKLGATLTLNGGGLQYGASFNLGRPVNIGANGATIDTNGNDNTLAGVISFSSGVTGTPALTKMGNGTLTLTGVNTFSGPLNVAGGVLATSSSNIPSAGAITLSGGGTLKNTGNMTIAQDLSFAGGGLDGGTNGITVNGTGNTTLNGNATINGTVTFNRSGGTVALSTAGPVTVTVASGATANFNGTTSIFTDGTNYANLAVNGSANLGGARTIGNLSGAATGLINTNANALTINQSGNSSYSGAFSAGSNITKNLAGNLTLANVRANSLTINAGKVSVAIGGGTAGTSTLNGLSIDPSAALDLGDHSLIVNYTGSSPIATIRSQIISGSAGGAWNGNGISSAAAASDTNFRTALGYAEASQLGLANGGTFGGQTVAGNAVLVKYTYNGDNDLDGKVTLNDFSIFVDGFNGLGSGWVFGDYNYDNHVDGTDLSLFVDAYKNQGGSLSALDSAILSNPDLSNAQKNAMLNVVPEPGTLSLLAIGAGVMGLRRRRKA